MTDYTVKNLSPEEFLKIEEQFFTIDQYDPSLSDKIFATLHDAFSKKEISQILVYRDTFWKIYVYLTWTKLNSQKEEDLDEIFAYQVVDAYRLGFDVYSKLMWFLSIKSMQTKIREKLYAIAKKSFMESEFYIGFIGKKEISIKELVDEVIRLNNQGNDSIKIAEFRSKTKKLFFPDNKLYTEFLFDPKDEATDNFFDLIHFFLGVESKDISIVVDMFLETGEPTTGISNDSQVEPEPTEQPTEPQETPEINTPRQGGTQQKPTPQEIKLLVESKYKRDEAGHFEDIEGAFGYLQELSNQHNDPKITDLLYFDEASGAFLWNEE